MGQFNWIYFDDFNRRYNVGIYHGDRSGNLVIYCNTNILIIDFNVISDKTYSFYLNENLCEIEVEKQPDAMFAYSFEVNEKADTPLNRARRDYRRKERRKLILLFVLYVLCILVGIYLLYK